MSGHASQQHTPKPLLTRTHAWSLTVTIIAAVGMLAVAIVLMFGEARKMDQENKETLQRIEQRLQTPAPARPGPRRGGPIARP
jgi:hypothetical protein